MYEMVHTMKLSLSSLKFQTQLLCSKRTAEYLHKYRRADKYKPSFLLFQPRREQMLTRSYDTFRCNYSVYTDSAITSHRGLLLHRPN